MPDEQQGSRKIGFPAVLLETIGFLFGRENAGSKKFCNIFAGKMLTCQQIGAMLLSVKESALISRAKREEESNSAQK